MGGGVAVAARHSRDITSSSVELRLGRPQEIDDIYMMNRMIVYAMQSNALSPL
jgi:hypothetical protein